MTGFGYNLMGMGNVLSGGVVRHLEEVFAAQQDSMEQDAMEKKHA